jgi:acetyltransferase
MTVSPASLPGRFRAEKLFHPASVAVIGDAGAYGRLVLPNLHAGGFAGPILSAPDADALPALPQAPDLALVCQDGAAVAETFAALARRGTRAAIVFGMTEDVGALARRTGVRAFGPGSFGLVVPAIGLDASRGHLPARPGRLALVSQSASMCRAVLDWAGPNGVGFSHIVGLGGNGDLGFAAALDWLSRDSGTGAILLDLRRIKDARRFLSAARAAARLRPVVAIRAGGRLLDPSGTADAVLDAALHRSGVLTVTRLADLLAAAETLTRARRLRGEALAIATNAVGPAWLAADAALREGLHLAVLAPDTRAALGPALAAPVHRPDARAVAGLVHAGGTAGLTLADAAARLAAAPEVGGVLVVHAPPAPGEPEDIAALAAAARAAPVPVLVAALGDSTGAAHRASLAAAGVPVFPTPEDAVRGLAHLVRDRSSRAAARELPPSAVLEIAPDRAAAAAACAAARAAGRDALTAAEARDVLAAYGIAAPEGVRLAVEQDAVFGPVLRLDAAAGTVFDLPPLNPTLAAALVARARLPPGTPAAPVADALLRLSQLVVDLPDLARIEIAAPAPPQMRLLPPGTTAPVLAIAPYPAELAGEFHGVRETFLIRPIRPEDAAAHAALFARLPPQDVRFRFFSAVRALSDEQIARLTQVDYDREIAFIAVRPAREETVGVARLVQDAADGTAEFAIVVQPDAKGQGLATHLMQRLFDWAASHGVAEIVGQVLADNAPMLALVRRLGFTLHRAQDDETVVDVRRAVNCADPVQPPPRSGG